MKSPSQRRLWKRSPRTASLGGLGEPLASTARAASGLSTTRWSPASTAQDRQHVLAVWRRDHHEVVGTAAANSASG